MNTPLLSMMMLGLLPIVALGCEPVEASGLRHDTIMRPMAPSQLCRSRPAWRDDGSVGFSSSADEALWPHAHGQFNDWRLLPLSESAGAAPSISLTAGGGSNPLEITSFALRDADTGESCGTSYHTRRPDVQVVVEPTSNFLRLFVVPEDASNPTLTIRTPDGRYRCSDDHGRADWGSPRAALIDVCGAAPGLYAVWVGTHDGSSHRPATLYLTGDVRHHP